jgi:hypothetical protein
VSQLSIELFTDPAYPFAFSAEPIRQRLRWHYRDGLRWTVRMIVLTREDGEAGKLAQGAPNLTDAGSLPSHVSNPSASISPGVAAAGSSRLVVVGARGGGLRRRRRPGGADWPIDVGSDVRVRYAGCPCRSAVS